ncbi:hypothetical protein F7725_018199 [Dissostichus mawsoni]|uniref:Uncharacterized protein n=1 Tax=Dissostichus mawsoni TaxID=36200 RepID=A0A7J5XQY5_DISMA|nr:hypothetical protein F7725_018199 [Dissostichus mawsoni]
MRKRKSQTRETQPRTPERREQREMAARGASVWGKQHCQQKDFCITLSDADIQQRLDSVS